jgi:hypothetical protein
MKLGCIAAVSLVSLCSFVAFGGSKAPKGIAAQMCDVAINSTQLEEAERSQPTHEFKQWSETWYDVDCLRNYGWSG